MHKIRESISLSFSMVIALLIFIAIMFLWIGAVALWPVIIIILLWGFTTIASKLIELFGLSSILYLIAMDYPTSLYGTVVKFHDGWAWGLYISAQNALDHAYGVLITKASGLNIHNLIHNPSKVAALIITIGIVILYFIISALFFGVAQSLSLFLISVILAIIIGLKGYKKKQSKNRKPNDVMSCIYFIYLSPITFALQTFVYIPLLIPGINLWYEKYSDRFHFRSDDLFHHMCAE